MAETIVVPRLGWSMEEGTFDQWLKQPGEYVRAGELLFVLEGEKAVQEIEALQAGYLYLAKYAPNPGDTVRVGQAIGYLLAEGETATSIEAQFTVSNQGILANHNAESSATEESPRMRKRIAGPAARRLARELGIDLNTVITPDPTARILSEDVLATSMKKEHVHTHSGIKIASPRARLRAKEFGIDWTQLTGTGRNGRIRERDVLSAEKLRFGNPKINESNETPPIASGKHSPATKMRLAIAQKMQAIHSRAVPVTLTTTVDADRLVAFRRNLDLTGGEHTLPSYNDILVWIAARLLCKEPALNACWYREGIFYYQDVHVAIAIDTPEGLVAPVIRDANKLSLSQVAAESRQLITLARTSRFDLASLQGGTFTVTNLGMFGVRHFTPILNWLQSGILGIGRIEKGPVIRDDQLTLGHTLGLSLTFDHRVIDGKPAAQWLQQLSEAIACLELQETNTGHER